MTEKEALQVIQNRIDALKSDPRVQAQLIQMRIGGASKEARRERLTSVAIATLYGEPHSGARIETATA
jgi:hypothetical protein